MQDEKMRLLKTYQCLLEELQKDIYDVYVQGDKVVFEYKYTPVGSESYDKVSLPITDWFLDKFSFNKKDLTKDIK